MSVARARKVRLSRERNSYRDWRRAELPYEQPQNGPVVVRRMTPEEQELARERMRSRASRRRRA